MPPSSVIPPSPASGVAPSQSPTGADARFISFDNVDLAYAPGAPNAIEDVTIRIARNEFVAIVGPSGCGKSTFMKLCTGLKTATRGTVIVENKQVTGPLKITGMAFQAANLLPWRTTLDNVLLPLEIVEPFRSTFRAKRAEYVARAMRLIERVGLKGWEDKFPWELSGGMQQRASICRALIHSPSLLMLDEPFGALDPFTREELWCVLRDLHAAEPFTVVLVTHDLKEATFLADTVYVMSHRPGRVVARHRIDLPRPRELASTYTEGFNEWVLKIRQDIAHKPEQQR
jgi:NitT/TauT family transport system ATP-binding protein